MKTTLVIFLTVSTVFFSTAQGLVNFVNGPTTLFSTYGYSPGEPPAGSYYFGLLLAPPGTTDPLQFSFANVYATNLSVTGYLFGGANVAVPDWPPGANKSFIVAGWSSNLGHSWNQSWLSGSFSTPGYFGLSSVATSVPGNLFGPPSGIPSGLMLMPFSVPEPVTSMLACLGAATLIIRRQMKRFSIPKPAKTRSSTLSIRTQGDLKQEQD